MTTRPNLDEASVTANFDRLVEEGVIIYNNKFRAVPYTDQGFSVSQHIHSPITPQT